MKQVYKSTFNHSHKQQNDSLFYNSIESLEMGKKNRNASLISNRKCITTFSFTRQRKKKRDDQDIMTIKQSSKVNLSVAQHSSLINNSQLLYCLLNIIIIVLISLINISEATSQQCKFLITLSFF